MPGTAGRKVQCYSIGDVHLCSDLIEMITASQHLQWCEVNRNCSSLSLRQMRLGKSEYSQEEMGFLLHILSTHDLTDMDSKRTMKEKL